MFAAPASLILVLGLSFLQPLHAEQDLESTSFRVKFSSGGSFLYLGKGPASFEVELFVEHRGSGQPARNVSYSLEVRLPGGALLARESGLAPRGVIRGNYTIMVAGNYTVRLTITGATNRPIPPETLDFPVPIQFAQTGEAPMPQEQEQPASSTTAAEGAAAFTPLLIPLSAVSVAGAAITLIVRRRHRAKPSGMQAIANCS